VADAGGDAPVEPVGERISNAVEANANNRGSSGSEAIQTVHVVEKLQYRTKSMME
jgi:hypothetical protein